MEKDIEPVKVEEAKKAKVTEHSKMRKAVNYTFIFVAILVVIYIIFNLIIYVV